MTVTGLVLEGFLVSTTRLRFFNLLFLKAKYGSSPSSSSEKPSILSALNDRDGRTGLAFAFDVGLGALVSSLLSSSSVSEPAFPLLTPVEGD
jgi:hypothetical protein